MHDERLGGSSRWNHVRDTAREPVLAAFRVTTGPILNRGELAALFSFAFLSLLVLGGGRYSLDALIARRQAR